MQMRMLPKLQSTRNMLVHFHFLPSKIIHRLNETVLPRDALWMMSSAERCVENAWEPSLTWRRMGNWGGWKIGATIVGGHLSAFRETEYTHTQRLSNSGLRKFLAYIKTCIQGCLPQHCL